MIAAKVVFGGLVAVLMAASVLLITSLPTMLDIIVDVCSIAVGIVAGRKSSEWI